MLEQRQSLLSRQGTAAATPASVRKSSSNSSCQQHGSGLDPGLGNNVHGSCASSMSIMPLPPSGYQIEHGPAVKLSSVSVAQLQPCVLVTFAASGTSSRFLMAACVGSLALYVQLPSVESQVASACCTDIMQCSLADIAKQI